MEDNNYKDSVQFDSNNEVHHTSSLERIQDLKDKIGNKAIREGKRIALLASVLMVGLSAACGPIEAWEVNPSTQNVNNEKPALVLNPYVEKDNQDSLEDIWNKAIGFWSNTELSSAKESFFRQAQKYSEEYPQYSKDTLLALFTSIAMTESNGGVNLYNSYSGASGWFQVIPTFHLGEYNSAFGTDYSQEQLINDSQISIEVGTWALMRYANNMSLRDCMRFFKGGGYFGNNVDDGIWWNRVSYSMNNLMNGRDILDMGLMDYQIAGSYHKAEEFLDNPEHIAHVYVDKH